MFQHANPVDVPFKVGHISCYALSLPMQLTHVADLSAAQFILCFELCSYSGGLLHVPENGVLEQRHQHPRDPGNRWVLLILLHGDILACKCSGAPFQIIPRSVLARVTLQ